MAQIFADSFEDGTTDAWDGTSGTPTVSEASALVGTYGCEFNADAEYVTDDFSSITRYRCRFWIDPNGVSMNSGDRTWVLRVSDGATVFGGAILRYDGTNYEIFVRVLDDASSWQASGNYDISDGPNCVEFDMLLQNTTGYISLWFEGVLQETVSNIDCGTRQADSADMGRVDDLTGSPSGTIYMDHYEANDDGTEIGCAVASVVPVAMAHFRRLREQG